MSVTRVPSGAGVDIPYEITGVQAALLQGASGFRGEEEFGFNAEPYVRTGKFVKIFGL